MAQATKPSEESPQLSDVEREAFQEICDLLIPDDFSILGYNKKKITKKIIGFIEDDIAIIRLKLRKFRKIFERLTEESIKTEESLEEEDVTEKEQAHGGNEG